MMEDQIRDDYGIIAESAPTEVAIDQWIWFSKLS